MGDKNVEKTTSKIVLKVPTFEELWFREKLYSDPDTMDFGDEPFDFSRDKWQAWFDKWVKSPEKRFYAYLQNLETGEFVGDVNFHFDDQFDCFMVGVVILGNCRGRGFAQKGLKLLLEKAKKCGIEKVCNKFPRDRQSALHIHKKLGFKEICDKVDESEVFLECSL